MFQVNREELAWAAGFFDGEGHIGVPVQKHGKYGGVNKRLVIVLVQTQDGPLERFYAAVGVGKLYGPYKPRSGQSPYKQLHINTFQDVQHAVCQLWPWLSAPKKAQTIAAFQKYFEYLARPAVTPGPKPRKKELVNVAA
jgi:hypothetical protein